jgi:hypothetical protein
MIPTFMGFGVAVWVTENYRNTREDAQLWRLMH